MPVRRVDHDHVAPRGEQCFGAGHRFGRRADGGGHAQPAVLILVGAGMLAALEDVLDRDQAAQHALPVHHRQLLDAVRAEDLLRFVEGRAHRGGDEVLLRHRVANRAVECPLELQIAVGDDADQLAGGVDDRDPRDAELRHQLRRLAQRTVGSQGDRVEDHPRLTALHPVDLGRLPVDRHVLVNHADPARAGDRDRHFRLGDGVHRGRNERDVERNVPGEAALDIDALRVYRGLPRHEEDVVECEGLCLAEGSHSGS
jgi:hypothetical protein